MKIAPVLPSMLATTRSASPLRVSAGKSTFSQVLSNAGVSGNPDNLSGASVHKDILAFQNRIKAGEALPARELLLYQMKASSSESH